MPRKLQEPAWRPRMFQEHRLSPRHPSFRAKTCASGLGSLILRKISPWHPRSSPAEAQDRGSCAAVPQGPDPAAERPTTSAPGTQPSACAVPGLANAPWCTMSSRSRSSRHAETLKAPAAPSRPESTTVPVSLGCPPPCGWKIVEDRSRKAGSSDTRTMVALCTNLTHAQTCKEGHRAERQQRKGSDEVRKGGHELVGPGKKTALCPHPRTSLLLCPSPPSRGSPPGSYWDGGSTNNFRQLLTSAKLRSRRDPTCGEGSCGR